MKIPLAFLPAWGLATSLALAATETFNDADSGRSPPGWTVAITGKGEPKWTVEKEDSAPSKPVVLRQSAEVPGSSFPLCIKDGTAIKDGFVEVRFKAVSGKGDQAGGVIWRCADKDNYYLCRANALEDNVVLYKVEKGKRKSLDIVGRKGGYGVEEKVSPRAWHRLRVDFAGPKFTVHFDGKKLFEVQDETFKDPGRVGVWTKADSVTFFDDFSFGTN